jgi:hypothetical protein
MDEKKPREKPVVRVKCDVPTCKGNGVKGNENIINGIKVCDYCHAEMMDRKENNV